MAPRIKWTDIAESFPPLYWFRRPGGISSVKRHFCRRCTVALWGYEDYPPDGPLDGTYHWDLPHNDIVWVNPSSWGGPLSCFECKKQVITRLKYVVGEFLPHWQSSPFVSISKLAGLFVDGMRATITVQGYPELMHTVYSADEALGCLPPDYEVTGVKIQYDNMNVSGNKQSVDGSRFVRGTLNNLKANLHSFDQTIAKLEKQFAQQYTRRTEAQAQIEGMELKLLTSSLLYTKDRLAEFFAGITDVRRWQVKGIDNLEVELWPVKVYREGKDPLSLVCGPHHLTIMPSDGAFGLNAVGPHPHWSGIGVCYGVYKELALRLLGEGNLLNYLQLVLDLRRGWNEDDLWTPVKSVIDKSWDNFKRRPADFEYVVDGLSGKLLPFYIVKEKEVTVGTDIAVPDAVAVEAELE